MDYCAAVGRLDIAGWYASGVLVHPRAVVTVAHVGPAGGRLKPEAVALRVTDLSHTVSSEIVEGEFLPHEAFRGRGWPYDIAVLKLDRPATVEPVPLASPAEIAAACEVLMAGFGCGSESAGSLRLRRLIPARICPLPDPPPAIPFDPEIEFLAESEGGGACFGDSGGPAYISVIGVRKLAGIISRPLRKRPPFCQGPVIVTRIAPFRAWIEAVAGEPIVACHSARTDS